MAQQLPRCVQQASWMRVWSTVGGGGMSMRGFSSLYVCRATATPIRGFVSSRSQSLLILCRSSSSSSPSSSYRSSRSLGGSSAESSRIASPGIGRNFAEGFVVSGRGGLRASQVPLLSPFLTRSFSSSAEASAITDGFLKESLLKDAEEKSKAALAAVVEGETEKTLHTEVEKELDKAVEETVGAPLEALSALVEKEVDEVTEREALVAEIKSKELELAGLRSALRVVEIKHGVEVESVASGSVSLGAVGFPEADTLAEQGAASQVSAALKELSDHDFVEAPSGIDVGLAEVLSSDRSSQVENDSSLAASQIGGRDEGVSEENAGSDSLGHPWPEWVQFLRQLEEGGFFVNEDKTVVDLGGSTNDDLGLIKRACLNFSRERDDIFLHYSRKDLEVIARFGCPNTDRKVVNAGKRLRDFLAIDEISAENFPSEVHVLNPTEVCKPCALRPSCERRDFKASPDHVSGTPEVIRLLSHYALEASPYAKEGLQIPSAVQTACLNLIKETIALGAVPRDPRLPKIERKGEIAGTGKPDRRDRESKRKVRDADVEMKPGDWKCEKCEYVNFARNRTCRECDAFRPVPEMRPGDWRCPECNFVNFSRNQECHDCKVEKPAGLGYQSSYDTGSRYSRGAPEDRGSRFDRDRRSEVRSFDRDSERGSFGRFETRDNDRGSDRYDSWGGGDRESGRSRERSRERGGLERRSAGDEPRGGRRSNFEEWKPDLKKRGDFDEDERKDRRSVLDTIDDDDSEDDIDDFELDSDDDDISDVEAFEDEEFEDMRPAASASRGRGDSGRSEVRGRSVGRGEDKGRSWEDDRSFRSERSDRGSRGGGSGRRARAGGRGGRGDRGGDRSSSRDSRPSSYDRSDRDSRPASYERSDRDSGRSYGRSDRDSSRPSRGRGGGRGGGRGRGRGRQY